MSDSRRDPWWMWWATCGLVVVGLFVVAGCLCQAIGQDAAPVASASRWSVDTLVRDIDRLTNALIGLSVAVGALVGGLTIAWAKVKRAMGEAASARELTGGVVQSVDKALAKMEREKKIDPATTRILRDELAAEQDDMGIQPDVAAVVGQVRGKTPTKATKIPGPDGPGG